MKVRIKGKNDKMSRNEVRYAAKWMAGLIMSDKLIQNLGVDIEFIRENNNEGSTELIFDEQRPRDFKVCIDPGLSRKKQLLAMAHELVHVKQFALGEMRYTRSTEFIKWHKQTICSDNTNYYDLPWEIEAFGREYGMYIRYVNHLSVVKKKFHVQSSS